MNKFLDIFNSNIFLLFEKKKHTVLLLALCFFLLITNIVWFQLGGAPQQWDSAIHLYESLNAARIGEVPSEGVVQQALNVSWYYPPFVSYASVPIYFLLGQSEFSGYLAMTFFLIVLTVSVYFIGNRLFSPRASILAALMISCSPIVIQFSRTFMLDLPLGAMTTLAVYFLLTTNGFKNRLHSIYLGCCLSAGLLTKWTFPLFIALPFLTTALNGVRDRSNRRHVLTNIVLTIAVCLVIASPWYVTHIVQIISGRSGELERGEHTLFGSIFYYVAAIPDQISWFGVAVFIGGGILAIKNRRKESVFLLSWLISGYLFVTLIGFKQPRFSIPLLPPVAILAMAGIDSRKIQHGRLRDSLPILISAIFVLQYFMISFISASSATGVSIAKTGLMRTCGPEQSDWKNQEILKAIDNDFQSGSHDKANLRVVPDYPSFNAKTFEYYAALNRNKVVVSGISGFPMFTDYVVLKTGNIGDFSEDQHRTSLETSLIGDTSSPTSLFLPVASFGLPDGSHALVLRASPKSIPLSSSSIVLSKLRACTDQFVRRFIKPRQGYDIDVEEYSKDELCRGHIRSLRIFVKEGDLGDYAFNSLGLAAHDIDFELGNVTFDPVTLLTKDTLEILSVKQLLIHSISLKAPEVKTYIETSSKGKTAINEISFSNGGLSLAMRQKGLGATLRLQVRFISLGEKNVAFHIEQLKIGWLPIPAWAINPFVHAFNPLIKGFDIIPDVTIGTVHLENNVLAIGHDGIHRLQ